MFQPEEGTGKRQRTYDRVFVDDQTVTPLHFFMKGDWLRENVSYRHDQTFELGYWNSWLRTI